MIKHIKPNDAYISQTYGNLDRTIAGNPETEKQKNSRKFSKNELYDISQSERWKSLIYFEDAVGVIKAELTASKAIIEDDDRAENQQGPFHVKLKSE